MMTKNLTLIFFICLSLGAQAQFSMTSSSGNTYQELANPISLNNGAVWNEGSNFTVSYGFNFVLNNQTHTALTVKGGGGINFPGSGTKELQVFFTPFGGYLLRDQGTSSSLSDISYEVSGSEGNKVLKVQWKNAGFVQWHSTSSPTDYINFQIWLFEADHHLEIHFGSSNASPGTYGYPVNTSMSNPGPCINLHYDQCSSVFNIHGPADLPSYMFYNLCSPNYSFLEGTPSDGMMYAILPSIATATTEARSTSALSVFPNPAKDNLQISNVPADIQAIRLANISGQTYETNYAYNSANEVRFSVDNLPDGIYFVKIITVSEQVLYQKFLKSSR